MTIKQKAKSQLQVPAYNTMFEETNDQLIATLEPGNSVSFLPSDAAGYKFHF